MNGIRNHHPPDQPGGRQCGTAPVKITHGPFYFARTVKMWIFIATKRLAEKAQGGTSLHLVELRIPSHAVRDQSARLECHFDLDGETLYSVKWYKDGNEFYRYVPRDMPPVQTFQLPGVTVDIHNSTENQVVLSSVQLSTSGKYRCEVSGEAPSFQTVTEHGHMTVVALPEVGPKITGGRPRYQVGDTVRVNCTSGRSKPAAQLAWFINGEPADPGFLRGPFIQESGREGLETSTLALEFTVKQKHFNHGDMKLKCLATIARVYLRSNEESVEGEKQPKASVLESRGTVAPAGSRADRVQAAGGQSVLFQPHATVLLLCFLLGIFSCHRITHYIHPFVKNSATILSAPTVYMKHVQYPTHINLQLPPARIERDRSSRSRSDLQQISRSYGGGNVCVGGGEDSLAVVNRPSRIKASEKQAEEKSKVGGEFSEDEDEAQDDKRKEVANENL
ncbi:hypothetical protein Trydic_g10611 [Trypoxylus dichotomus]